MNRVFSTHHSLAWSLLIFFLLFLVVSTAFVVRLQGWFNGNHAPDLMAVSRDLHTLTSGSLVLSGLHSEEILKEESREMSGSAGLWNSYSTEVTVGDSFPLRAWTDGLRASLERAGARLSTVKEPGGMKAEIRYRPEGGGEEIIIERLLVRRRPSPEAIASRGDTSRPRASLVMDDLGQNPVHFRRLVDLGLPFTVSILPNLPYSRHTAKRASDLGIEILLHLPMEPVDFPEEHPGPGALFIAMTGEEIGRQLGENLESVPGAVGVNNHMGSRLTADSRAMEELMEELKGRSLFFLDSRTSPRSLAFETAYRFNIPSASRDIFIDAHDNEEFIRGQVAKLIERARKKGRAIGIGHPYGNTLAVLEDMKEELRESGIEWVPVSQLLLQGFEGSTGKVSSLE